MEMVDGLVGVVEEDEKAISVVCWVSLRPGKRSCSMMMWCAAGVGVESLWCCLLAKEFLTLSNCTVETSTYDAKELEDDSATAMNTEVASRRRCEVGFVMNTRGPFERDHDIDI